ncbi:MAG TPA: VOC family protein [Thermoanaerobaculia bacterium]|nr:VOC family protein [Thermoanaerobaculia bacterium]
MPKITPFLWFESQAEEAATFYTSVFKNSKIGNVVRHGDAGPGPRGSAMVVNFELDGQPFTALNGGPQFQFTEAISFVVSCRDQAEIDYFWDKLKAPGEKGQCGWIKDKYGLSWQIVPANMGELLAPKDPAKAGRAMMAMMQMTKIEIQTLQDA